ncbi:MAG: anti-sigma factor [Candidatus Eremiobacteraeota bacterium]|nr:anti-sigma factor [Candidatus Eremiobacteraeota bacterium]
MMNNHSEMLDDVAVYALGALPSRDASRVSDHLKTCSECRAEYRLLLPAVQSLALIAQEKPSDLLKGRIMKSVRATAPVTPRVGRTIVWPVYLVAAACFALALISTIGNISLRDQLSLSRSQVVALTAHANGTEHALAAQKLMLADVMATDAHRYPVQNGQVIERADRLYIAVHDLPPPPRGHVYQAWTHVPGAKAMTPNITFAPDRRGVAVVALPQHGRVDAVAISIEPDGGSKAPTTKPNFIAKIG